MPFTSRASSHIPKTITVSFFDPSEEVSLNLPEMLNVRKGHLARQEECGQRYKH